MTKAKDIAAYKHERTQIINRLQRIQAFANNVGENINNSLIKARHTVAIDAFREFSEVQSCIEQGAANATELAEEADKRVDFEDLYYETVAAIESLLTRHTANTEKNGSTVTPPSNTNDQTKIKLPVLTLPEFSGSFSEWLAFKDTFKSVIHENTTLSNVEKMHRLDVQVY
ncbi:hypothetical protein Zmor_023375 [Zophobas morio]|uniref:Uncharacterized protein n=1 Tax=Zophobas morio TaxID=2755281 RepID=A0AA38HYM2_9CUCU|nr:hypothetical protein Zmor_023375 [Zophobas morio]